MGNPTNKEKILCFGEVLWDMLPQGKKIGGAPLNVAYHLRKLGADACVISRIGKDSLGTDLQAFLDKNDLNCGQLQIDPQHDTSVVQATIDHHHEVTYCILEKVAWDFIAYNNTLEALVQQAGYLVFGSLAIRDEVTRDTLYKLLDMPDVRKVLDVNLRPPFYSKPVIQKLLSKANLVKMNEAELQIISDWLGHGGEKEEKMQHIADRFNIDLLMVTLGAKGACLWFDGAIYFEESEAITVVDTVGSGDAFLAGFLSEYIKGQTPDQALKTANKTGAFVAQKPGGCPEYERSEIFSD